MLYDGYYVYLPLSDREVLDRDLPGLTGSYDDLRRDAAVLVRDVVKWDKVFALLLTQVSNNCTFCQYLTYSNRSVATICT